MISVEPSLMYDTARLSVFAKADARPSRKLTKGLAGDEVRGPHVGEVLEWALPGGEVVGRKVVACGDVQCWLRADLADATVAALAAEAADYAKVTAELAEFIRSTDERGAARNGVSVQQYRAKRHAAGSRWDYYRAANRAGV